MLFKKKSFKKETRDNFKEIKGLLEFSMGKISELQEDVGALKDNIDLMLENNKKTQELLEKILVQTESELVNFRKVL